MTMQLQFSHQDYQKKAVDAVVKVFHGQPLAKSEFSLAGQNASVVYAPDGTIGNALKLSDAQLLANVQAVQKANFPGPDGDIKPGFCQPSCKAIPWKRWWTAWPRRAFALICRLKWKPARARPTPSSRRCTS